MNFLTITPQERGEYQDKIRASGQWWGELLEKYIFGRSPLLATCAARFFYFSRQLLFFLNTTYGRNLLGLLVLYCIFFCHRAVLDSYSTVSENTTVLEKFAIGRTRGKLVFFGAVILFLATLERITLALTYAPSVESKISALGWDEEIQGAQNNFPFQLEILPPILLGLPFITLPLIAALWGYFAVLFIKWDVRLAIAKFRTETINLMGKALDARVPPEAQP
jgi:hypothetical protein